MADTKGSALPHPVSVNPNDLVVVVVDPNGSPSTQSITVENLTTSIIGTSGTKVAAGDDSRFSTSLQKTANLSDLTNVVTARSNLGLSGVITSLTGDVSGTGSGTVANTVLATVPIEKGGTGAVSAYEAQGILMPLYAEPGNEPDWGYPTFKFARSVTLLGDGATFTGRLQMTRTQALILNNSYGEGENCIAINNASNFGDVGAFVDNSMAIGRSCSVKSVNNNATGGIALGLSNKLENLYLFSSANHGGAIGNNNTVNAPKVGTGNRGFAIGDNHVVNHLLGFALGSRALVTNFGGLNWASGQFATTGDAQIGFYVLRNKTTDSTQTTLFLDGTLASQRVNLLNNQAMRFEGSVIAKDDTQAKYASWRFTAVVTRGADETTTVLYSSTSPYPTSMTSGAKTINIEHSVGSASAWTLNVSANTTTGGIDLKVTGETGVNIAWVANLRSTEVLF